jgi:formate dehydrogenase subunit delta
MHSEYLVQMANDIATFFSQGGQVNESTAAQDTLGHIQRFWEPRMRAQIVAMHPTQTGDLLPVAQRAVELLAKVTPAR